MGFDNNEYGEALDEFLIKMEEAPCRAYPDVPSAVKRLAELLDIAEIKSSYLKHNAESLSEDESRERLLYRSGIPDGEKPFEFSKVTANGSTLRYTITRKKGAPALSDAACRKLGVLTGTLFVFNERLRAVHEAEYLAYHDRTLGFYNMDYLVKFIGRLISNGSIGEFSAVKFNLKSFSYINSLIGREKGTAVMVEYISKLEAIISDGGIVARLSGDNFAALFRKGATDRVLELFHGERIEHDRESGEKVLVMARAGFYDIDPAEVKTPADVTDRISVSLNIARSGVSDNIIFYDKETARRIGKGKEIEDCFPDALKNEEFKVFYQPKVSLKNYRLAGAEALCRWFHEGEQILPYRFIPVLEQTHAITLLDFYMLDHACRDIRGWLDEGRPVVKVSVNLSRRHLGDVDLLERILSIIDRNNVPHEYIEIELTETTTDVDFRDLKEIVTGLQKNGISTSVDDFGMGYSSLNLIRELPWNVLKIDKSFIDENDSENNSHSKAMLRHTISMAQEIGMECIVEGVETINQVRLLKENNCFLAQGFFFDRPLPKDEFEKRLDGLR